MLVQNSIALHTRLCLLLAALAISSLTGCGATKTYVATEQLLLSDAVDTTVGKIDFTPLAGHKVFLDTTFVSPVRSTAGKGLVSSEYIVSSVREQMLMAGCLLSAEREKADVVAELRVGAMGTDGHSVVVGLPATNQASSIQVGGSPLVPALPEIGFAKRDSMTGGVKVAVFAYARESRDALWQSGIAHSISDSTETWVLGVGPKQEGSIHRHSDKDSAATQDSDVQVPAIIADQAKHRNPQDVLKQRRIAAEQQQQMKR